MDAFQSLSDTLATLSQEASVRLFHVPSPLGGRTALTFDGKFLLVPALQAEENEKIEILSPGNRQIEASVRGFDPNRGLAVLEIDTAIPEASWPVESELPKLGSLLLAAAWPSPQGAEVRLDTVRFAGGEGEAAYIQTDGASFPGFAGGALVSGARKLVGFIVADRSGNKGWAMPAATAKTLVAQLRERGFPGRAWLGVSTVPVEAPKSFAALFGDSRETALMVAGLEAEGPAALAGLLAGDLFVTIDGSPVTSPAELHEALDKATPGTVLHLVMIRGGSRLELEAKPGKAPGAAGPGSRNCGEGRGRHGHRWHWGRHEHGESDCGGMPWGYGPGR